MGGLVNFISHQASQITLHLSVVKGPVLDKLERTEFLKQLKPGKVYFRTEEAVKELA
jgi:sulfate permease, SulP family